MRSSALTVPSGYLDRNSDHGRSAAAVDGKRFAALWARCVPTPPSPDGAAVHAEMQRMYGAPYRRFHNMVHIRDCVRQFDEVAQELTDPDSVELALWFHDVVYDIGASTNERRSAEMFLQLSTGAGFAFRHRVCSLIMATRHNRAIQGNDRRYMVDIDLSGFAAPWDEFMRTGANLREESANQTDAQYHALQIGFLQRLQRRDRFFATDYYHDRYEAAARANLRRLIDELEARGYAAATR